MPGRKPKPTALSIVQGNPGKRPLPKNEPKPKAVAPNAPAVLSVEAKKHWRIVVKQLHASKLMTRLDIDALVIYCESYARWVDAVDQLREEGLIIKSPQGYSVQNPLLSISNKAFDQMRAMLVEFGMTPSSRTKVTAVDDSKKGGDPWGSI